MTDEGTGKPLSWAEVRGFQKVASEITFLQVGFIHVFWILRAMPTNLKRFHLIK